MRAQVIRLATVSLAGLTLAACRDDSKTLLAPEPDKALVLWNPNPFPKPNFPPPPNPEDFMDITAGDFHTCARKYNGNVYCWGMYGGDRWFPGATQMYQPTLKASGAKMITAGAGHTCMLDGSGLASCWGIGDLGQLGIQGSVPGAYSFGQITGGPVAPPPGASAPLSFTTIDAGGASTCAATATNQLYCWGELGAVKTTAQWSSIVLIATFNGTGPQLAVGHRHACITLDSFTEADCWGKNDDYQAGVNPLNAMYYFDPQTGVNTQKLIFAQANDLGATVRRASADSNYTCADRVDGTVSCFGNNDYGQLGKSTGGVKSFTSQWVGNGMQLKGVATGNTHACALDPSGNAYCWGDNRFGQLGAGDPYAPGSTVPLSSATPLAVIFSYVAPVQFRAIAAGSNHTCAIGKDNHVYCWGQKEYGQLGIGNAFTPGTKASSPLQAIDP